MRTKRGRPKSSEARSVPAPSSVPAAQPIAAAHPPAPPVMAPENVPPAKIRRNVQNPRIDFNQTRLEALATSIEEQGLLVPITVYHDPGPDGTEYVLLDGERRWKASKLTNAATIPAWIIPKPSGVDNVLRMFNIHLLRDEWGEMATALALRKVIEETKVTGDKDLSRLTGLAIDRVRNMRRVLSFPDEWQEMILDGTLPFNFPVELDKAVLSKTKDPERAKVLGKKADQLRDLFLKKYLDGVFDDVVDLRKVGTLIETAVGSDTAAKRAKLALRTLVSKSKATIEEAYETGAAASIELTGILRDIDQLPGRLSDLLSSSLDAAEQVRLRAGLVQLRTELDSLIEKLPTA